MKVFCKRCKSVLSNEISHYDGDVKNFGDTDVPLMPLGYFKRMCELWDTNCENIVINNNDIINLKLHTDSRRFQGCCGNGGCNGPTHICICGTEIATEVNDCYTDNILHFENNKVEIKNKLSFVENIYSRVWVYIFKAKKFFNIFTR